MVEVINKKRKEKAKYWHRLQQIHVWRRKSRSNYFLLHHNTQDHTMMVLENYF